MHFYGLPNHWNREKSPQTALMGATQDLDSCKFLRKELQNTHSEHVSSLHLQRHDIAINFMNQEDFSIKKAQLMILSESFFVKKPLHFIWMHIRILKILFGCYLLVLIQYLEQEHGRLDQCTVSQHNVSNSHSITGLGENARKEKENQKFSLPDRKVKQKGNFWREGSLFQICK